MTTLPRRRKALTLSHETRLPLIRLDRSGLEPSCETEVAYLQLAIGVDEQVAWFQVPVQDVGRVDVLPSARVSEPRPHL
jgi:hypothetical protein